MVAVIGSFIYKIAYIGKRIKDTIKVMSWFAVRKLRGRIPRRQIDRKP